MLHIGALPPKILILRILFLSLVVLHAPIAVAIDISDVPLEMRINTPAPMIMLVWDDSGSMDGEFMTAEPKGMFDHKKYLFADEAYTPSPDHVDGVHRTLNASQRSIWSSQWAGYNRIYYDPRRRYLPWPSTGKYTFQPADPHRPFSDPKQTADTSTRLLLAAPFLTTTSGPQTIVIPNAHYFVLNDVNGNGIKDPGEAVCLVAWQDADGDQRIDLGSTSADDQRLYFRFDDDGDGIVEKDELVSAPEELNACRAGAALFRTDREELQNFANWFTYHRRREFAGKSLAAEVISGLRQSYVGIYAVNSKPRIGLQPVKIIEGPAILDRSESLLDALYAAESEGRTPLRCALDQVGRYFHHGSESQLGAFPFKPEEQGGSCQSAHAVIISDGFWNGAFSGVGNADGDQGKPYADGWNDTLGDVAMHYYKTDLSTQLSDQVPSNSCDKAAHQHMRTHAFSFGVNGSINRIHIPPDSCSSFANMSQPQWPQPESDQSSMLDDLLHAAVNGRGLFFDACDPQRLLDAFPANSGASDDWVSSAGWAVSDRQTDDRSIVYQTGYRPDVWSGDVLAFAFHPSSAAVDARAENALWRASDHLSPSENAFETRRIVTYGGIWREPQGVPFRYSDLSGNQKRALGSDLISGSPLDRKAAELLDYIRGREFPYLRKRSSLLGDIVHGAPVLAGDTLYVGANDGMLHALDALTGRERFAYVPNRILPHLNILSRPDYSERHRFYVDATPFVGEVFEDQYHRKTYLLGGLGKGGKGYYCLRLQSRQRAASQQGWGDYEKVDDFQLGTTEQDISRIVMWEYPRIDDFLENDSGLEVVTDADIGYSFAQGYVVNANAPRETFRPVAIFSNGYSSKSGRAVLYILEAATGKLIRKIDTGSGADNGLSAPALIDVNLDRRVDYVYAGDLKGNLWKFDLSSDQPNRWGVAYGEDLNGNGVIDAREGDQPLPVFQAGQHQPITARPDIMSMAGGCAPNAPGYMVVFGTGKYLGESDRHDVHQQSIFGIWDFGDDSDDSEHLGYFTDRSQGRLSSGLVLARRQVVDQVAPDSATYRQLNELSYEYETTEDDEDGDRIDANNRNSTRQVNPKKFAGWFLDFPAPPDSQALAGERVTGKVVLRNRQAVITSFAPTDQPCDRGAVSWMYVLNACGADGTTQDRFAPSMRAKRHLGRINDDVIVVKNGAMRQMDLVIGSDPGGSMILQEIPGEKWGKVYWKQHLDQ